MVLTADCLPVFLCRETARAWRLPMRAGAGSPRACSRMPLPPWGTIPRSVLAWLGPAIGPAAFEVGPEVREAFLAADDAASTAFAAHRGDRFLADLYALARQRLARAGVASVSGGGFCTYSEHERFFSYRRVKESGRLGAFIWIDAGTDAAAAGAGRRTRLLDCLQLSRANAPSCPS